MRLLFVSLCGCNQLENSFSNEILRAVRVGMLRLTQKYLILDELGRVENPSAQKKGKVALFKLSKHLGNPIIAPRPTCGWEVNGTFNPGAILHDGTVHLLYRGVDENLISRLGYARITDGSQVVDRGTNPVLEPSTEWEELGCEDPRITRLEGQFLITYTAYSKRGPRIALASSKDFTQFEKHGLVGPDRHDKDCVIFPERIDGKIAMLHRLESRVQIAYFDDLDALVDSGKYWEEYLTNFKAHEIMRGVSDWEQSKIGIGPTPLKTPRGWLVIYHGVSAEKVYRAGAVLLDLKDPRKILARTREPILEPETTFERRGIVPNVVFPDGAVVEGERLSVYYGGADRVCCVASAPVEEFLNELENSAKRNS